MTRQGRPLHEVMGMNRRTGNGESDEVSGQHLLDSRRCRTTLRDIDGAEADSRRRRLPIVPSSVHHNPTDARTSVYYQRESRDEATASDKAPVRHLIHRELRSDVGHSRTSEPRWDDLRMGAGNPDDAHIVLQKERNDVSKDRRRRE